MPFISIFLSILLDLEIKKSRNQSVIPSDISNEPIINTVSSFSLVIDSSPMTNLIISINMNVPKKNIEKNNRKNLTNCIFFKFWSKIPESLLAIQIVDRHNAYDRYEQPGKNER